MRSRLRVLAGFCGVLARVWQGGGGSEEQECVLRYAESVESLISDRVWLHAVSRPWLSGGLSWSVQE